jgi:hypothetical protein
VPTTSIALGAAGRTMQTSVVGHLLALVAGAVFFFL